jgi:hypothetical protein
MPDFVAKPLSFARLNGVLGTSTPPIPYCWSGSEVFLDSGKKFDEKTYRESKLNTLLNRQSPLKPEEIRQVFERVIEQNLNILYDLHNSSADKFQQYDAKFNLLLESAFSHAENEHSLKISKENIKNSLQISDDGWINAQAVDNLFRLTSTNPMEKPDKNKFVPKHRR